MNQEREAAILEAAIDAYGTDAQTDVAIEEMAEPTKAIIKYRRCACDATRNAIMEEMADVGIILNQLALIYGDPTEWEIAKLERLERRLASRE